MVRTLIILTINYYWQCYNITFVQILFIPIIDNKHSIFWTNSYIFILLSKRLLKTNIVCNYNEYILTNCAIFAHVTYGAFSWGCLLYQHVQLSVHPGQGVFNVSRHTGYHGNGYQDSEDKVPLSYAVHCRANEGVICSRYNQMYSN